MKLRKNWRKLNAALSRFWHREAGPMNWKNPVRVVAKTDSDAVALVTIIYNPLDGGSRALGLEARFRSCGCRSSGGSWKHLEISLHHG